MITKAHALLSLAPHSEFSISDGAVTWIKPPPSPITDAQIDAEIVRLQAEYDAKQYQRDRAAAYPSIQEQLDMQYWDSINGTTTWQDAISAVKSQYTKN